MPHLQVRLPVLACRLPPEKVECRVRAASGMRSAIERTNALNVGRSGWHVRRRSPQRREIVDASTLALVAPAVHRCRPAELRHVRNELPL